MQHIPILRENWVISLHGLLQTTLDDDDAVPYFLLPSLGSGSTLRGYSSWRFRDRHSLLMSGELRWIPNRLGLDMAIFYDTGKVTQPSGTTSVCKGLKSDVGIGIRFHSPLATPLRIELAQGQRGLPPRVRRQRGVLTADTIHVATRIRARSSRRRCCWRCWSTASPTGSATRRFYDDDPLAARAGDAGRVEGRSRGTSICSSTWRSTCSRGPGDPTPDVRARNVNTIDEVPDSSWFTNRILARGRCRSTRRSAGR